jgi:hypothetical protein
LQVILWHSCSYHYAEYRPVSPLLLPLLLPRPFPKLAGTCYWTAGIVDMPVHHEVLLAVFLVRLLCTLLPLLSARPTKRSAYLQM